MPSCQRLKFPLPASMTPFKQISWKSCQVLVFPIPRGTVFRHVCIWQSSNRGLKLGVRGLRQHLTLMIKGPNHYPWESGYHRQNVG